MAGTSVKFKKSKKKKIERKFKNTGVQLKRNNENEGWWTIKKEIEKVEQATHGVLNMAGTSVSNKRNKKI